MYSLPINEIKLVRQMWSHEVCNNVIHIQFINTSKVTELLMLKVEWAVS